MSEQRIKAALAELSSALSEHIGDWQGGEVPRVMFNVDWLESRWIDGAMFLVPNVTMRIERMTSESYRTA